MRTVYRVEKSFNNLHRNRWSEMMTIGTINDLNLDSFDSVKDKCAIAFNMDAPVEQLVLTRGAAKIYKSAFLLLAAS